MNLDPQTIQALYRSGNMRPTGEWVICAGIGCESVAAHDVVHEPSDGQRFYVPLCIDCISMLVNGRIEYFMESHGFMGEDQNQ